MISLKANGKQLTDFAKTWNLKSETKDSLNDITISASVAKVDDDKAYFVAIRHLKCKL